VADKKNVVFLSDQSKFNYSKKKDKEEQDTNELEDMVSFFEKKLKSQRKKLKKKKLNLSDSAGNIALLNSLLEMMIQIIPTAEKVYRKYKNERAAYAIVALVTQSREISADIQRYSNVSHNATNLINKIIIPTLQLILQNYLNLNSILLKELDDVVPKKFRKAVHEKVNSSMQKHGNYLKEITLSISDKTNEYFSDK
jgi:C4-dicarboxylate-specific signal transduction histidine kinase